MNQETKVNIQNSLKNAFKKSEIDAVNDILQPIEDIVNSTLTDEEIVAKVSAKFANETPEFINKAIADAFAKKESQKSVK